VRRHWSIEKDSWRIRSKNGVQNFATLRKVALDLLKREPAKAKLRVAQKRKCAGYLTEDLLAVLGASTAG
jgi:hypothetical protein